MRYPCEECEMVAYDLGKLRRHVKSNHEEVIYPCVATDSMNLKRHIKRKHSEVRYLCDKCDYSATTKQC